MFTVEIEHLSNISPTVLHALNAGMVKDVLIAGKVISVRFPPVLSP